MLCSAPGQAQSISCATPSSSHTSCTIPASTFTQAGTLVGQGDNGGSSSNGKNGPDYTLTNNGTISISNNNSWGLLLESVGGDGSNDGHTNGGDGGVLRVVNNGSVTIAGTSTDTIYGFYVESKGGQGGGSSSNTGAGSADGGRGGDGGFLTFQNYGAVTINQALQNGGVGIFVESRAGQGGDQDSGVGDQKGGNSGDAKNIAISNAGPIVMGTSSNYLSGASYGWGIAALGRGNEGGADNGKGGTGSAIEILNSGTIGIYWNGTGSTSNGLRGIYGLSQGGDGTDSHDNSDAGGAGESGFQVVVSTSGNINVYSRTAVSGLSGGIVAISQGGKGGQAPGSNKGGDGGNGGDTTGNQDGTTRVSASGSAVISTYGDGISGVVVRSRGGDGGDGEDGSHDSSGGDGGHGGAVAISLNDTARISTAGTQSFGIVGQSIGGRGGNGGDKTALVGQSGGGGYGGDGGSLTFTAASGTQVSTNGTGSAGLVLQSIGGGGGTAGDFVGIIGGAGGDGGRGGDAGNVQVTARGSILTYGDVSPGIIAQSIAGSGGAGQMPDLGLFSLGGSGGDGGSAGQVSVTNSGIVLTLGYGSIGLIAQSISGGGGSAGSLGEGYIAIGGDGGGGGKAGQVYVENQGVVQTAGTAATGILAQSIGSGGGNGTGPLGIILTLGGTGGAGGSADKVAVVMANGSVVTAGDYANGITAQSIGGGGGNGGDAFNYTTFIPNLGVGGSGGAAGNGDQVFVGNVRQNDNAVLGTANIATSGDNAIGILAQSIGGGGGSGGSAAGVGIVDFINLQIGGDSAGGTRGDTVQVVFTGLTLTTTGSNSTGIVAQSIGGGGGTGGAAYAASASLVFNYSLGVGGIGGSGGQGGAVNVSLTDSTITTGQPSDTSVTVSDAVGILAQSVGGGGGSGGRAATAAISQVIPFELPIAITSTESIGGDGGASGNGGAVSVTLAGHTQVYTGGSGSHAILAQSIGGGGGNGGTAWSYAMTSGLGGGVFAFDLSTDVGGKGASGGQGGNVSVHLADSSLLSTIGNNADGIVAQSVGGGGGNGGVASASASGSFGFSALTAKVALGGFGGQGGNGGDVAVAADSGTIISTLGGTSYGIVAQSVGGGGGTSQGVSFGASEKAGVSGTPLTITLSESISIGLSGGDGGNGGRVAVTTDGTILTQGIGAIGVVAQSIGGGGGIGGSVAANAVAAGAILSTIYQTYQFNLGIGGTGGGGGDGGTVSLTHAGKVVTTADHAIGILGQSIGGGGGVGGTSTVTGQRTTGALNAVVGGKGGDGGQGNTVSLTFDDTNNDLVQTSGYMAHGVVLQSIGGGGGVAADASDDSRATLSIGGNAGRAGGGGNDGGLVQVLGWANLSTRGDDAIGLIAQSVGGGGGIGGTGFTSSSTRISEVSAGIAVGGTGGAGGDGGNVAINAGFNLATAGARAYGILAQSIGGGGGYGGAGSADMTGAVAVGGQGGVAGNGGTVSVTLVGGTQIATTGAGAHAVVAQSVGGGGGIGDDASGAYFSFGRIGTGGNNSGDGGTVAVTADATISTTGANAFGILAQSIGNGGGFGGDGGTAFAGSTGTSGSGKGGAVTVVQAGSVVAVGNGGVGIFAQSQGAQDQGKVQVEVKGVAYGGSGDQGAGVLIAGGKDNVLAISGSGYVSAASGVAIRYVGDRTTSYGSTLEVLNTGTVDGNVILSNANSNQAGTVYDITTNAKSAGTFRNFGTFRNASRVQADVVNAGTFMLGGQGASHSTQVTGSFTQTETGLLIANADFAAGTIDQLVVGGDATLKGRLQILPTTLLPDHPLAFLTVDGKASGTLQGTSLNMFDFSIGQAGETYSVQASADFTKASFNLTAAQARVAQHFQDIWNAGGGSFGSVFATLATLPSGNYGGVLSALGASTVSAPGAESIALAQQRADRLMSCPVFEGDTAMVSQTSCVWAVASGQVFNQTGFAGAYGYGDTAYTYAMGAQKEIAPNWFLGVAAGYEDSLITGNGGSTTSISGSTGWIGASLKYETGPWLFAGAATGSFGTFDSSRLATLGSFGGLAQGTNDLTGVGGRARVAYTFPLDRFYVRPFLDLDLIYTSLSGYTETGAGLLDLQVSGASQWTALATPALEVGTRLDLEGGYVLRGYAKVGATFSTTDGWTSTMRLEAAPASVGGFSVVLPMDDVFGRVGAGVDLMGLKNGISLRAEYEGAFSEHTSRNMGSLRFAVDF